MRERIAAGDRSDAPLAGVVDGVPAELVADQRAGDKVLLNRRKLLQTAFFPADDGIRKSLLQNGDGVSALP